MSRRFIVVPLILCLFGLIAPGTRVFAQDAKAPPKQVEAKPKAPKGYWLPEKTPLRAVLYNASWSCFQLQPDGSIPEPWRACFERNGIVWGGAGGHTKSLIGLSAESGHPELANAPVIYGGLSTSGGGIILQAQEHPDRVLAVVCEQPVAPFGQGNDGFNLNRLNSDGYRFQNEAKDVSGTLGVPIFLQAAAGDTVLGSVLIYGFSDFGRRQGAPWTYICQTRGGHGTKILPEVGIPWLEAVIAQRLPADMDLRNGIPKLKALQVEAGWLGNPKSLEIAEFSKYTGNKANACWLPDKATAEAWQKFGQKMPYEFPEQPKRLPSGLISNLVVHDPKNNQVIPSETVSGNAWKIVANLKEGDNYCMDWERSGGFRFTVLGVVPSLVRGCDWIKPDSIAANFTGEVLLEFTVAENAIVYVAHDERIEKKPAWLGDWKDTGEVVQAGVLGTEQRLRLFEKSYPKNARVKLGQNGEISGKRVGERAGSIYLTIVKPGPK